MHTYLYSSRTNALWGFSPFFDKLLNSKHMEYLLIIFLIIIIVGLLANRELARDKHGRVKRMIREYSFKTYSPEDEDVEKIPPEEAEEKRKEG